MKFLPTMALLAALTTGCKQEVLCPALGNCGGRRDPATGHSLPPTGIKPGTDQQWVLAPGHPSCTEDLYVPAADTRLIMGQRPTTGMPYPEPAVFDWCVLLVTGPGLGPAIQVNGPRFYYESGPIGFVTLKYQADGHFAAGITRTGTFTLDFPAYCVQAFGAMDGVLDPTDPTSPTVNVCKRLEVPVYNAGVGEGAYENTTCAPNTEAARLADRQAHPDLAPIDFPIDPGGCFCRFDVSETAGPAGDYRLLNDNTIVHLPDAVGANFPQEATFCEQGDTLQLTGTDGTYLFDQKGVRTLDLVRVCTDASDCTSGVCDVDPTTKQGICN
jgi:hypothetical protein